MTALQYFRSLNNRFNEEDQPAFVIDDSEFLDDVLGYPPSELDTDPNPLPDFNRLPAQEHMAIDYYTDDIEDDKFVNTIEPTEEELAIARMGSMLSEYSVSGPDIEADTYSDDEENYGDPASSGGLNSVVYRSSKVYLYR